MFQSICEALLHDAVGGEIDADRELARRAGHLEFNWQTGVTNPSHERLEFCQARLGSR